MFSSGDHESEDVGRPSRATDDIVRVAGNRWMLMEKCRSLWHFKGEGLGSTVEVLWLMMMVPHFAGEKCGSVRRPARVAYDIQRTLVRQKAVSAISAARAHSPVITGNLMLITIIYLYAAPQRWLPSRCGVAPNWPLLCRVKGQIRVDGDAILIARCSVRRHENRHMRRAGKNGYPIQF
ncbi:unnamed protein product, partial [Iphiclides podalirius]